MTINSQRSTRDCNSQLTTHNTNILYLIKLEVKKMNNMNNISVEENKEKLRHDKFYKSVENENLF